MTDPWDLDAQRITDQRTEGKRVRDELTRGEAAQRAAEQTAAEDRYREMQIAIAEAVPQLTQFLNERGAAARRLLAAVSRDTYISFGGEREGGSYYSVCLDKDGLVFERGAGGDYGTTPSERRIATPQEAVEAFARDGRGHGNPQQVRNIVSWLTKRLNDLANL